MTTSPRASAATLATNAERLVRQPLRGEVWPALADRHAYRVDADGVPFVLPGMGGVTLGVHPGDVAAGYAADHLEPGLSIRHRPRRRTTRCSSSAASATS